MTKKETSYILKTASTFTALGTLGLAFVGDFKGTVINVGTIIILKGCAYLVEEIIGSVDKKMTGFATFTSYCFCAIAFLDILKSAQSALLPLTGTIN